MSELKCQISDGNLSNEHKIIYIFCSNFDSLVYTTLSRLEFIHMGERKSCSFADRGRSVTDIGIVAGRICAISSIK